MLEYAALVASPRALPDGLILVFQHPVREQFRRVASDGSSFFPIFSMPIRANPSLYLQTQP